MEIIATRKKDKDIVYVLVRNIVFACMSFFWAIIMCFCDMPLPIFSIPMFLLGIVLIYFGVKDYKFNKKIEKLPEEALCKHYGKIFICNEKEEIGVKMKDIEKVTSRRYIKSSFGFAKYVAKEGVLSIKTKDITYRVESVKDVKNAERAIKELIENNKAKVVNKTTIVEEKISQTPKSEKSVSNKSETNETVK